MINFTSQEQEDDEPYYGVDEDDLDEDEGFEDDSEDDVDD